MSQQILKKKEKEQFLSNKKSQILKENCYQSTANWSSPSKVFGSAQNFLNNQSPQKNDKSNYELVEEDDQLNIIMKSEI